MKSKLTSAGILSRIERGDSCSAIASEAGVRNQSIRARFQNEFRDRRILRRREHDAARTIAIQSADFRNKYRAALKAAGWKRCPRCKEWRDGNTHGKCDYCRFCKSELSRRTRVMASGLEFIPNDPEIWWRQHETGERRTRITRTPRNPRDRETPIGRDSILVSGSKLQQIRRETARLDGGPGKKIYAYQVTESAVGRFLELTAKLPNGCGPEAIAATSHPVAYIGVSERHQSIVKGIVEFIQSPPPAGTPAREAHDAIVSVMCAIAEVSPDEITNL